LREEACSTAVSSIFRSNGFSQLIIFRVFGSTPIIKILFLLYLNKLLKRWS
jgi:hypothetical protein